MTTPGAPLLGDTDNYRGERVLSRADIDVDDVADKTASTMWCWATCLSIMAPPFAPLFCAIFSPCGAEERIRRKMNGTRLLLTETAVHFEVDAHDNITCCGCTGIGKQTKTIPLNNVTDVQVVNKNTGCCACWSIPRLDIHTPSDPIVGTKDNIRRQAEVECPGVRNADDFRNAFYAARSRGQQPHYYQAVPVAQPAPMGAPKVDITAQLKELMEMRNAGGLTEDEFQQAKKKLLS